MSEINRKTFYFIVLLLFGFVFTGCDITETVPKGKYLLHKTRINVDKSESGVKQTGISIDEMNDVLVQKPIPGIVRSKIWFYNYATKGKQTAFKKWVNRNLGAKPVIFDPATMAKNETTLQKYLDNHGFFNSRFSKSYFYRGKKAIITFGITLSKPYFIRNITYQIPDPELNEIIMHTHDESTIKTGQIYNADNLESERERIFAVMRDNGFYTFDKEYIYFEVDSTLKSRQLDIKTCIQNQSYPSSEDTTHIVEVHHPRFFVRYVNIFPEFNPLSTDTGKLKEISDTTLINRRKIVPPNYRYLFRKPLSIKPQTLNQFIYIEPLGPFRQTDVTQTYRRLSTLQLFKYINIYYKPVTDSNTSEFNSRRWLDCFIDLSRKPVQSLSLEAEATNTGGNPGMAGIINYSNSNFFRGGEIFYTRLKGALELQRGETSESSGQKVLFFNSVETGIEFGVTFPTFLIPFSRSGLSKYFKPKTTIRTAFSYQKRVNYERYITNLTFGYKWEQNTFITHELFPFEVNSIKIDPDSIFSDYINSLQDRRLKNQYTNYLINSLRYAFTFRNQNIDKPKNFIYFRSSFESAGNFLGVTHNMFKYEKNATDQYTVFNIPFAQYVRFDFDFRYYNINRFRRNLVFRTFFGIGIPYGNSMVLPFEKGYFAGGSNGMRGFVYRRLGPGSFLDLSTTDFEKMGDLQIEFNLEWRLPVYSFFHTAIFTDAGNIWLLKSSADYPGGDFKSDRFIKEFAVDGGIGLRFDFSFFIFRLDPAVPIFKPSNPENDRFVFTRNTIKDVVWNFGIGYPF